MLFGSTSAPKVYRLRPTITTDSYGDPVETWDPPQRLRLPGADVQAVDVEETDAPDRRLLTDERELFIHGRTLPELTAADRIEYAGEVYTIEGDPLIRTGLMLGHELYAHLIRLH